MKTLLILSDTLNVRELERKERERERERNESCVWKCNYVTLTSFIVVLMCHQTFEGHTFGFSLCKKKKLNLTLTEH